MSKNKYNIDILLNDKMVNNTINNSSKKANYKNIKKIILDLKNK